MILLIILLTNKTNKMYFILRFLSFCIHTFRYRLLWLLLRNIVVCLVTLKAYLNYIVATLPRVSQVPKFWFKFYCFLPCLLSSTVHRYTVSYHLTTSRLSYRDIEFVSSVLFRLNYLVVSFFTKQTHVSHLLEVELNTTKVRRMFV